METKDHLDLFFKDEPLLETSVKAEIKKSIVVNASSDSTQIFVIAHSIEDKLTTISYKDKGVPLSGCVYDAKFQNFYIECSGYLDLGTIPISFFVKIANIGKWISKVPMPESVITKYLDEEQLQRLKMFKNNHKTCSFDYLQLVSCY